MANKLTRSQTIALGVAAASLAALLLWRVVGSSGGGGGGGGNKSLAADSDGDDLKKKKAKGKTTSADASDSVPSKNLSTPSGKKGGDADEKTPLTSNARSAETKSLHTKIEEIDRRGKALFKGKKYSEAAEAFTEAIDLIEAGESGGAGDLSAGLTRQLITLINNRSAMYEKSGDNTLALVDCDAILDRQPAHQKARNRRLRILEAMGRPSDALIEVCALQLQFMQENRDKIRMGIPLTPPVSQNKIEDLMGKILPGEIERFLAKVKEDSTKKDRPLPSEHTILQLLQSFAGYSAWMAQAAKSGSVASLTKDLSKFQGSTVDAQAERATLLLKRGRRYAYDRKFEEASADFEAAMKILEEGGDDVVHCLDGDTHARLLEWCGMARHLRYNLDGALKCYEKASDLDSTNPELLVKRAGVKMDGGKHDDAEKLFEEALGMDPDAVDALLHRANLNMLRARPEEAKADLNRLLGLRPNHLLARLRLATVLMSTDNIEGAKQQLDLAEGVDSNNSEVHSYRGELYFAGSAFAEARAEFDKAIACEPNNPTPYVNAALSVMNTPGPNGGVPDVAEAIQLLEKSIAKDPMFYAAYVHLGQLRLSTATDLKTAEEVVELYDKGLEYCRTEDESKDILSMRILTVSQVLAASSLRMDTLMMQ
mmetsp:Transcript_24376/g.70129  ORF Transcript_24376/g.70129 Transcript_24376/m.70129 type:complete len:654 (+) Transcript_24376:148-2109(+)